MPIYESNPSSSPKTPSDQFLKQFGSAKFVPLETKAGKFEGFHLDLSTLDEAGKMDLYEILAPVALNAFGKDGDEQFKKDCYKYLCENNHVFLVFEGGNLIAYRQWAILESKYGEVVYLGGAFIKRDSQGKGIATKMLDFVIESAKETNPDWKYLAVVTQNSIIQKAFNSLVARQNTGSLYQFGDTDIPEDVQEVARVVAISDVDDKLDPATLLSKGSYGTTVYSGDAQVGELNEGTSLESIDVDAGDAVYSVWRR